MKIWSKYKPFISILNWYLNLVVLFLLSLHVGGYSSKKVILWALISITLFAVLNKNIRIDWQGLVLIDALLLYGIIYEYYFGALDYYDWWHMEDVALPPILMYIVCQQMTWEQNWHKIKLIFLSISLGTFIYSILNHYVYLQEGFIVNMGRCWNDFWTHTSSYATEFSYWGVFIVGLFGYAFYHLFAKKRLIGLCILTLIVIENYIHIAVDNRMVLMVTVMAALSTAFLYIYFNRKDSSKIKKFLLLIIFLIIIGSIILIFNIGGIRDSTYLNHFFSRDGGILKNIRFQAMWESILMLPSHWKGGRTMNPAGLNAPHNYWLLVADDTGLFTFTLWMVFNIGGLISIVKLVKSPQISKEMKYLIVPDIIAVVSYLMMETGGGGRSDLIIFYVIFIAIINQSVSNLKNISNKSVLS